MAVGLRRCADQNGWAWLCWLASHPEHDHDAVQLVAALVSLPPFRAPVRWLVLSDWGSASQERGW